MLGDVLLDVAQRTALCALRRQLDAELPLTAGAAEEDDHEAGDGERDITAEVLLHEVERSGAPLSGAADRSGRRPRAAGARNPRKRAALKQPAPPVIRPTRRTR
ncbi:hypothetical protein JBE04_12165 [Streptomyces sp. PRKS01-29]|nr:hypothetical protein [Streptomyces sabulosicollis]